MTKWSNTTTWSNITKWSNTAKRPIALRRPDAPWWSNRPRGPAVRRGPSARFPFAARQLVAKKLRARARNSVGLKNQTPSLHGHIHSRARAYTPLAMRRPDAACQPSASPAPKSTFWSKMLKKMVKWPSDKAASGRRACRSFLARLRRAAGRGRGSARTDLAAVDVVDSAQPRRLRCLPAVAAPARPRPPPPSPRLSARSCLGVSIHDGCAFQEVAVV